MAETADILIVGGGVMASSLAYHLRQDGYRGRILIFEKDRLRERSSTSLSTGGIRQLFGTEVNVRLARYSIAFYEEFGRHMRVDGDVPDIRFRQRGYLFLGGERNWPALTRRLDLWRRLGVEVDELSPKEAEKLVPGLFTDDLEGAMFGRRDGYLDPYAVMKGFEAKARSLGAEYLYDEVVDVLTEPVPGGSPAGPGRITPPAERRVTGVKTAAGREYSAPVVVAAAGAWTGLVCEMAGLDPLVVPTRRQIFVCRTAEPVRWPIPLTIDPSGLHWREEEGRILLIQSFPDDPQEFDFTFDRRPFEGMWFQAAGRWPFLEQLGLERGWAGLYDMNLFDHNALIGPHPELAGFYIISGFSGHGMMQAPAAGKALAEIITQGRSTTLPVEELYPARIRENRPVVEEAVI